jgi:hypothetical protein
MKTNKHIEFPYYSGNIYETDVLGIVTLEEFINVHKFPKDTTEVIIKEIAGAAAANNLERKRTLKQKLFSFTPCVKIEVGVARKYSNISEWTGLMQLDFDGIEDPVDAVKIKEHIFENYKQIVCAYVSPSGRGVKALMRTIIPKDIDHYRALHRGMQSTFEEYGYLDLATKNAVLPLFLSADHKILYRDWSECEEWDYEDWTVESYSHLNDVETTQNFTPRNERYGSNYNKTIRTIKRRISNIIDEGHPQVRSTALILGSRVAAGYMDEQEARQLLISEIGSNSYLQKGLQGYYKTAVWALNQGMLSPKYY